MKFKTKFQKIPSFPWSMQNSWAQLNTLTSMWCHPILQLISLQIHECVIHLRYYHPRIWTDDRKSIYICNGPPTTQLLPWTPQCSLANVCIIKMIFIIRTCPLCVCIWGRQRWRGGWRWPGKWSKTPEAKVFKWWWWWLGLFLMLTTMMIDDAFGENDYWLFDELVKETKRCRNVTIYDW